MKSYWIRVGSNQMTGKKRTIWTQTHRKDVMGRWRVWGDAATSQRTPGIAGNWQKHGESHGPDSPLEPLEGFNPVDTLIPEF